LVYDGTKTRWGDGSATSPVYLPNIQEVNGPTVTYVAGITATGQLVKTIGASGTALVGGVAGSIVYQTAPSTTGFTAAGTTGQLLSSNGASTPTWLNQSSIAAGSATTATTATKLASGVAGAIPYQSSPSNTAFTAAGTSGQVLSSNGTSTPTWLSQSALSVGSATNATNATNVTGGTVSATTGDFTGTVTCTNGVIANNLSTGTNLYINNTSTGGRNWIIANQGSAGTAGTLLFYDATAGLVRLYIETSGNINANSNPVIGVGYLGLSNTITISSGTGSPEGNVTAPKGSLYTNTTGASTITVLYVKTSGSGNTGWTAK
jgi:hypothetical protein